MNERLVAAWARRLERVLREAPEGIEALVTDSSIAVANGPALRPWSEAL